MKLTGFLILFSCSVAYGQRKGGWEQPIQQGDSLEVQFANDTQFASITDTLPIAVSDENSGWRDMRLVKYFYDSSNELKKIIYRHGQQGYYYFYLDGKNLRKVRMIGISGYINSQYYFSDDDNRLTLAEIAQREKAFPDRTEYYGLLKTYRNFVTKFKNLL